MEKTRVVVIGGGLGGLCAGVKIKEAGIDDFLIFDRHPKVGGVWYENKYPGCCSDTQVAEYEFIFAPNPNWSHLYPRAAQIQAYAEAIAQNFQISNHLRLSEGVSCATWDEDLCLWRITTEAGKKIEANAIITALGQLNRPALPAIEGRNSFAGASMHSARWDDTVSMKGKAHRGDWLSGKRGTTCSRSREGSQHAYSLPAFAQLDYPESRPGSHG
jgi:cation diffusion facilitator CzcD-associated flavoprotein CzcO